MKYKRKSDGKTVDAVQWQPGVDPPAIVRVVPPSRGEPGGGVSVRAHAAGSTDFARPGDWLIVDDDYANDEAHVVPGDVDFDELYEPLEDGAPACPWRAVDCEGAECSLWHGAASRCALASMADSLLAIVERMG